MRLCHRFHAPVRSLRQGAQDFPAIVWKGQLAMQKVFFSQLVARSKLAPAPVENIVSLAREILKKSDKITQYCEENGYQQRTFQPSSPSTMLPSNAPNEMVSMQYEINDAAAQIQMLTTDSSDFLMVQAIQNNQLACLRWLCHFQIPQIIPFDNTISYHDIAIAANVPESDLKSISRMAMLINFLREPISGQVAHSNTSASFVKSPNLMELAKFFTNRSAPMAAKMVESTALWGSSKNRDHTAYRKTAYNIENATCLPIFEHIASEPELRKEYGNYMKIQSQGRGMNMKHLLDGYDWESLGDALVVDVGGNTGNASIALATKFSRLKFVIQDLAPVVIDAVDNKRSIPPKIASRITFQEHDFFAPQPQQGVDVFLLRMIIHDWRDVESKSILKHLIRVLKPGGRIIIMDTVMPEHGTISRFEEEVLRVRDLTMLQAHNNNERDLGQWKSLIQMTDEGLVLESVTQPFGSLMAIIELSYDPGRLI